MTQGDTGQITQAKFYWSIQDNSCLQIKAFRIEQWVVDNYDYDDLSDEWTTYFTPLCQDTIQIDQFSLDTINQGFQNNTNINLQTWFFKWYFRLGYMWNPYQQQPILSEYSYPWFSQITSGVFPQLDQIKASLGDNFKITWDYFVNFWLLYQSDIFPSDWLPITVEPDNVQSDEDYFCSEGYFLTESRKCLKCPPGCFRCTQPNQCLECTTNFEMVKGDEFSYCFLGCFERQYRQTQYKNTSDLLVQFGQQSTVPVGAIPPKEMMQTCKQCPDNCDQCYQNDETVICTKCINGLLDLDGRCPFLFQSQTYLKCKNKQIHRCDDITIHLNTTQLQDITWQIITEDEYLAPLVKQLEQYFNGKDYLMIPNNITEHMVQEETIKIVLTAQSSNGTIQESVTYQILQTPLTQIVATTKMLYFQAGDPFKLNLMYYYPHCLINKYKPVVQDPQIECKLLNKDHSILKQLNDCQIQYNSVEPGNLYKIQIDFKPDIKSALLPQTHYVSVYTEQIETYCSFGVDLLTISASEETELTPYYYGSMDLIDNYIWSCTYNKSACTLQIDQNQKWIASFNSTPLQGKNVTIDLTIQSQIGYEAINVSTCSVTYEIVNQFVLPMTIKSTPEIYNYVDPLKYQQFECVSDIPVQIQLVQIKNGTQQTILSAVDYLFLTPNTLKDNNMYQIVCKSNSNAKAVKNFTTNYFDQYYDFVVDLNSDINVTYAFTQPITLEAIKLSQGANKTLKCEFGFYNEAGFVTIEERSSFGRIYSTTSQSIDTVLPQISGSTSIDVFCICYLSDGQKSVKKQKISLKQSTDKFKNDKSNPRLSDIIINFSYYKQINQAIPIDLIVQQIAYYSQSHQIDIDDFKQITYMIKFASGQLQNNRQLRKIIDLMFQMEHIPRVLYDDLAFILAKYQNDLDLDYFITFYNSLFESITRLDSNFTKMQIYQALIQTFNLNKTQVRELGGVQITLGSEPPVQVQLPKEIVLERFDDVKLVSMVAPIVGSLKKTVVLDSESTSVTFISNQTSLDLQTVNLPSESMKLQNLNYNITVLIPYHNESDVSDAICIVMHQNVWKRAEQCSTSQVGYFACCTDSLSSVAFALVIVHDTSFYLNGTSSNLALILLGSAVVLLGIGALGLEISHRLIFGKKPIEVKSTVELELQSAKYQTPARNPMNQQDQSENQIDQSSKRDIISDRSDKGISLNLEESKVEDRPDNQISADNAEEIKEEVRNSDIEIQMNEPPAQTTTKKQSCYTVYCSAFMFYNRVMNCISRHYLQSNRLVQVFTLAAQLMIGAALITILDTYSQKLLIAFVVMRPIQILVIKAEQVKSNMKWLIRLIIGVGLVASISIVATHENKITNQNAIIKLVLLETVVWDAFVMPILVVVTTRMFAKWSLKYQLHN